MKKLFLIGVLLLVTLLGFAQPRKTVLQVFWWDYHHNNYPNAWANYLTELAPRLKAMGIDAVWIPPTVKNGFTYGVGYAPFDNYDLGDKFQKGATRTRVGTKDELLRMMAAFHANGIEVVQDIVMNHVIGAGSDNGGGGQDPNAFGSEKWTNFRYTAWASPATDQSFADYGSRLGRFYKTRWNFHPNPSFPCTTGDWCEAYWGPDIAYTDGSKGEANNMGAPNVAGRQVDQTAQATYGGNYMKGETNKWAIWYKKQMGFDGVRMDAIKHFDYSASEGMLWNLQNAAGWANGGTNMFAIGEFVGGVSDLDMWCAAVNNRAGTFDFGLRGFTGQGLQGVTSAGGAYNLGNLPSEQQSNRGRTVPFVNNHDTFRPILAANGDYSKGLGDDSGWNLGSQLGKHIDPRDPRLSVTYAVALAVDGSPQIFFEDLFDVGTTGKRFTHDPKSATDLPARSDLVNLIWCRQALNFMGGAYKVRWQAGDALVIERSTKALIAVNDHWTNWQNLNGVQTDWADGTVLKDYSGANGTATRTVYGGGKVNIDIPPCNGTANNGRRGYCVWAPVGQDGNTYNPPRSTVTTQEWEMADDLGDSHCQSLGQGGALPANSTVTRLVGKIYAEGGKNITPELFPVDNSKEVFVGIYDNNGVLLASQKNTAGSGLSTFTYNPPNTGWYAIKIWNATNTNPAQRAFVKVSYTTPATITNAQATALEANNKVAIWTGAWSSDWAECRNWEQGIVPNSSIDVIIPFQNNTNVINITGAMQARNIRIEAGNSISLAPNGSLTVAQNMTVEGGITNNGTISVAGNVVFVGNAAQNITGTGTLNITNQFTINKTANTLTWALQTANLSNFSLQNGGFTIAGNANTVLNQTGNWTKTGGTFTHTDGKFVFNNPTTLQTIQSNDLPTFRRIELNKSGGDLKLLNGINISQMFLCQTGDLDLNGQTLDLGSTGVIQEDLPNNHIIKDLTGTGKTIRTGVAITTDGTINHAGLGIYLSQAAGTPTLTIERFSSQINSTTTVVRRNYRLTATAGTLNTASLKLAYSGQEMIGVSGVESNFKILSWNGTAFADLGGTANVANKEVTATGLTPTLPLTFTVGELKTDITLTVNPTNLAENSGSSFEFNFSRGTANVGDLVVNFAVKGTSKFVEDFSVSNALTFTSANGSVLIANGQTNKSIFITVTDDMIDEGNETVILELKPDPNYAIGTPNTQTVTITENDVAGFTVTNISSQTTRADGTAVFSVRLNSQPTANVSTNLTSDNTTNGGTIVTTSLTFTPANWNIAQFVTVTGAAGGTGDVIYNIVTSAATSTDPKYNGLNPADAAFTNKDVVYTVQITPNTNPAEPATNGSFNIAVNPAPTANLVVTIATTGTATGAGTDYTLANGTNTSAVSATSFTFAAGQTTGTLAANVADDAIVDPNETVIVTLQNGTGYTVGANSSATLTVTDNDVPATNVDININASADTDEYNTGNAFSQTSGGTTWYMKWDNTHLYVAITGANEAETGVLYLDFDNATPVNSGTGNATGRLFNGVQPVLPFHADAVLHFNNGYREIWHTALGTQSQWFSGINDATDYAGNANAKYSSHSAGRREFRIAWTRLGIAAKPDKFNFFGYIGYVSGGQGGFYGKIPTEIAASGTHPAPSPAIDWYFTVPTTSTSPTQSPFTHRSYTMPNVNVPTFGAVTAYDFTVNRNTQTLTRTGGAWTIQNNLVIGNGTLSFGAAADAVNVANDVIILGGTLSLSTSAGGDLNLQGNWNKTGGTFTHNSRAVGFNGTKQQTISHDANNFGFLSLNKTANNVRLLSNSTLDNTLTLTQGRLDLNGNTLALGTTGVLAEDRANNHVVFDGLGTGSLTASRTGIGALTDIAGTGISLNGTGLGVTVTRRHNLVANTNRKNYEISGVSGTIGGTVEIEYASSELNNIPDNGLRMVTVNGTNLAHQGGTVNTTTRKVTLTGVTSYGGAGNRWTAGQAPSIELESPVATVIPTGGTRANVGSTSVGQPIDFVLRVKNTGSFILALNSLTFGGTNAGDFSLIAPVGFPFQIATSDQHDFVVRFNPTATGARTATLTINNSDNSKTNYVINLSGTALAQAEADLETPVGTAAAVGTTADYASQNLNSNTDRVFRMKNTGGSNLIVSNAFITGTNASDFTFQPAPALPNTIAAAGQTDYTIRFRPSVLGNRFATVTFYNNDSNEGIYQINLTGEGVSSFITVESPIGTYVPSSTDRAHFASVNVGSNTDHVFRVRNTGTAGLNITNATIIGANASDFSIVAPPTYPQAVTGSGQFDFSIRFAPTATGIRNATVRFDSNDPTLPVYLINISGMGITPEMDVFLENGTAFVSSTSFQFTETVVNQTQNAILRIRNNGTADLTINSGNFTPATDFAFNPAVPFALTLTPNSERFVTVRFAPTTGGTKTAELSLVNNDLNENPYRLFMTGLATQPLISVSVAHNDLTPSTADNSDFGSINFGTAIIKTFQIQNTGNGNLNVGAISFSGTHASNFTIENLPPNSIAQNASNPFAVRFTPSAAGLREAFITIPSNAGNQADYRFKIQGTGLASPNIEVRQNVNLIATGTGTFDAGIFTVNNSSPQINFEVRNTGNAVLNLNGTPKVQITGANASEFAINQTNILGTVGTSASTFFTVTFTPTNAGAKTAFISIANDVAGKNPYTFTLTGTGQAVVVPPTPNNPNTPTQPTSGQPVVQLPVTASVTIAGQTVILSNTQVTTLIGDFEIGKPISISMLLRNVLPQGTGFGNGFFIPNALGDQEITLVDQNGNSFKIKIRIVKQQTTLLASQMPALFDVAWNAPAFTPNLGNAGLAFEVISGGATRTPNGQIQVSKYVGEVKLRVWFPETDRSFASNTLEFVFRVVKVAQTINFPPVQNRIFGDQNFALNATASSFLTVSYEVLEGKDVVEITNGNVRILKSGSVRIRATQNGDEFFHAAQPVEQTLQIARKPQTISFTQIPNLTFSNNPNTDGLTISANSSAGLPVRFAVSPADVAEVQGNRIIPRKAGVFTLIAMQEGNEQFEPAQALYQYGIIVRPSLAVSNVALSADGETLSVDYQAIGTNQVRLWLVNNTFSPSLLIDLGAQNLSTNTTGRFVVQMPFFIPKSDKYEVRIASDSPVRAESALRAVPPMVYPKPIQPFLRQNANLVCVEIGNLTDYKIDWFVNGRFFRTTENQNCIEVNAFFGGRVEDEKVEVYAIVQQGTRRSTASTTITVSKQNIVTNNLDSDLAKQILVYPNPSKGEFRVQLDQKFESVAIKVYDSQGRAVLEKTYSNLLKINELIDLGSKPTGVYYLRLETETGSFVQKITVE